MNAKEQSDVYTLSASMLLDEEQADILGEMEIGKAVVKLQGRIQKPFMIQIPLMPIKKGLITDGMLEEKMKPCRTIVENTKYAVDLSDTEMVFLKDVALVPNSGVAARYRRCGLSGRQGDKIKHLLLEKGCIQEKEHISPKGMSKVLSLSESGENIVRASAEL